ncbi:MAG TPA: hypothetical protein VFB50_17680, partial [Chloroflexota bacterium]|nr:hypothetical protein [Chloroflexota bacterium]
MQSPNTLGTNAPSLNTFPTLDTAVTRLSADDLRIAAVKVSDLPNDETECHRLFGFPSGLFTPDGYNPKTKKGRARGYATAILHFAPANLSGYDVCQYRTAGCTAACLNTAGHGGIALDVNGLNDVQRARIARTRLFFLNRAVFNHLLARAIRTHIRRATRHGLIPVVRLNGTSDLPWERLRLTDGRTVLETFPEIQFYDYTKHPERAIANAQGMHPANYALTFSQAESNLDDVARVIAAGANVATVFKVKPHSLPPFYNGRRVIDGDNDDLRFLDPANVYVGLAAKGRGKKDTTGFVVDLAR